jgi:hypothetical protein
MKDLLTKSIERFRGTVNLLVVDDDLHILSALETIFMSPVFTKTMIKSYDDAVMAMRPENKAWHCWVLDIDLGENRSGIDLMKAGHWFPFVIIMSGLQSMCVAAEAVNEGAMAVFDKSPDFFQPLFDETCRTAVLGYLLGGKHSQYLATYRLLGASFIKTPEEWAEKACVTLRQLHRICELHPCGTPKTTMSLFYTLYMLLLKGRPPFTDALPQVFRPEDAGHIKECIGYTLRKN